jgi:hypothetical protein
MLAALEQKLAALLSASLDSGDLVTVGVAPLPLAAPEPGFRVVRVSLRELSPEKGFERELSGAITDSSPPRLRRTLSVGFLARVEATVCPDNNNGAAVGEARGLLLEDLSLAAHALDAPELLNGSGFAPAGDDDPGYEVREFRFEAGTLEPGLQEGCLTGELTYRGRCSIWPVGVDEQGDEILGVTTTMAALPARISVDESTLGPAAESTIRIALGAATRLVDRAGATTPLRVAATVLSDVSEAERGTISSGEAAPEGAFRLHTIIEGLAEITFQAPADGVAGPRVEYVAVHLARPDGGAGVFLGSTPIRLVPGA